MPEVLNMRTLDEGPPRPNAVYVGRPTKWGNPWTIGVHGTREKVIQRYATWLYSTDLTDIEELRGKDLVCWCAPLPCHADVLLEAANR